MSSSLQYLLGKHRWDEAASKVNTEEGREELGRKDEWGFLPLHRACIIIGAPMPMELVEAMLEGYPEAVSETSDVGGRIPIHWACNYGMDISPRLVRLLIDAYPEGAKATDITQSLPLHCAAYSKAPVEVLTILIKAHPEGVTTHNGGGRLPLQLLPEKASPDKKDEVEKVALLLRPFLENEYSLRFHLSQRLFGGETPLDIGDRFGVLTLHMCVRMLRCPADVVMTMAKRHHAQLRERDESGNLPLHMVAANPNLNGAKVYCETTKRKRRLLNDSVSDGGQKIYKDFIGEMVLMYPEAAAALDGDERFPLSLAIESGKKWTEGFAAIADAAEHTIAVKDEVTGLFPFMLASTVDDPCLTAVYSLLRRCPELKRYYLD